MPQVKNPAGASIADLAEQLASMESDDHRTSGGVSDEALGLRDQIATMQPVTIADAAAVIAHAATAAWELPIIEELPESATHQMHQLERRLLAVLPIVVAAAGGSMDDAEFTELRNRRAILLKSQAP